MTDVNAAIGTTSETKIAALVTALRQSNDALVEGQRRIRFLDAALAEAKQETAYWREKCEEQRPV